MIATSTAISSFHPIPQEPIVRVGLADLPAQYRAIRDEVWPALEEIAEAGAFVLGPHVAAFEKDYAAYVGVKHCIGVNSGTSALHLALLCAGVLPGDEVITVPMSFIATSWAISYVGAKPVFVDVDRETFTMDPAFVERRITARTKAILPVHLYGQMAAMDPLRDISRRHGIPLIEDAAQAHGADIDGRRAGSFGQSACFSFYPGKNLGAFGEAGAITTDDDEIAARCRSLRDHAQVQRYHHDEIGFNYRMDAFQGAVLRVKLKHLDAWTRRRRELAKQYQSSLASLPLELPFEASGRHHVWHQFVTLHPERDRIRAELEARGIQTGLHYPLPLHLQEAYAHLGEQPGAYPVTEQIASECMSLPLFAEMTQEQFDATVSALSAALEPLE